MKPPDKIVLEHAGALGDFLLAWPALVSVARHFSTCPAHHHVTAAHAHWLAPVSSPCPPRLRRALDARYASEAWPPDLEGVLVVRPGLSRRPEVPVSPFFWFLRGLVPGRDVPPRELYRDALAARGVPVVSHATALFREYFGGHVPQGNTVLLFPGAGHLDKAWPLARLEALAGRLAGRGARPVFVLGPAEEERGVAPGSGEILRPGSLAELAAAVRAALFVVGPDSGPMHLAAMHGVPGLALFGPTSPGQWGPAGMAVLTAGMPCSPCVSMTAGAFAPDCPRPLPCLDGIGVDAVWEALLPWLP
jgi:ADP-heptose:LPS heptosyltransferase